MDTISYALERCAEILTLRVPEKEIKRTTLTLDKTDINHTKRLREETRRKIIHPNGWGMTETRRRLYLLIYRLELTPDHPKNQSIPYWN